MDREDCPFHCDIGEDEPLVVLESDRKPPVSVAEGGQKVASALADRRRTGKGVVAGLCCCVPAPCFSVNATH